MESKWSIPIYNTQCFYYYNCFSGGIFSPGAAFAKTSLIKQLNENENEIQFEVLSETNI